MNKQQEILLSLAPTALEIEIIGMVQDPEDENAMCNAESVDLEPTSWDIFMKVPAAGFEDNGDEWDGEDCEFADYDSAYAFGEKLAALAPIGVELQA
jgi:hypothetical protein